MSRERIDYSQFETSNGQQLPNANDSFESKVKNYAARNWNAEKITDQLLKTRDFYDLLGSRPGESPVKVKSPAWHNLHTKVLKVLDAGK